MAAQKTKQTDLEQLCRQILRGGFLMNIIDVKQDDGIQYVKRAEDTVFGFGLTAGKVWNRMKGGAARLERKGDAFGGTAFSFRGNESCPDLS
ncbi:hypothetical protein DPMN_189793 [Dreissena polymorpha]|uniref:Uncharacterized protein n=1 Tax=Dreissena polymorpha TaxID=45954 RepID=A0A9D4ICP6_DREPO|nr:hypothetical protein DPMN_189793 [Dreissena polymorpha]